MRFVLDTNVFLVSLSPYSDYDPDDDKFVDLAVAGNADFIVTNDRHFKVLVQVPFPLVKTVKAEEFLEMLAAL